MKLEQTTLVHFSSKFIAVFVGFLGTVYFAREVGAQILGTYFLILGLLTLMKKMGSIGVRTATTKYLSENQDPAYITSGFAVQLFIFAFLSVLVFLLEPFVNRYVGAEVALLLIFILFIRLTLSFLYGVLDGEQSVHVSSVLESTETILRTSIQAAGILVGFKLGALVFGYIGAVLVVIVLSAYFVSAGFRMPDKSHLSDITSYVKYSWLGGARSVSFAWMDTLVLGLFVANDVIGVYEIAWMASSVLAIFGTSVSRAVFPEISNISQQKGDQAVSKLTSKSIAYAGLLLIPGIIGFYLLGEPLLLIYGGEFVIGSTVLVILAIARLLYAYQQQFLTSLNAINRPDLAFRISAVFTIANVGLNFVLIYLIGWTGAAIATAFSSGLGLVLSASYLSRTISVNFPYQFILQQAIAAGLMGLGIIGAQSLIGTSILNSLLLVILGIIVYFSTLSAVSPDFRAAFMRNILSI
ncbi:Membrane protein involved in the export of O-antigen and teichoic acid [Halomicrobium zhouii]|uniref:Membrane protein involved in the export of O-antigen and teichoic acid n=1 Tax=Halomicrobium zhouii TaxID=767519 RepID=A0A1I6KFU9_9EURY|nr:polysaccharide biosynthesis C-terminal domain-containing protein [Halomicrobium zhouii]SFR90109.1 Membrane protein involved in the export of O-antigen and teichoic acid [Halomicrobium zhouii]